jgi:hypothetical protein
LLGVYDPDELSPERDVTPPASVATVIDSVATPLPTPPAKARRMLIVEEPTLAPVDLSASIAAATTRQELEGLVKTIKARPETEKEALRLAYDARLKVVSK